jgi:5-methylcytosine-specific restriction endonuclease McrA
MQIMYGAHLLTVFFKNSTKQPNNNNNKSVEFKGETGSTTVAAQDQAISTNCFKNIILKEKFESKCRLCKQHEETIDHITSGCPVLA